MHEYLRFQLAIRAEFWDTFPMIDIAVDGDPICQRTLDQPYQTIDFSKDLEFDKTHLLTLRRWNKTDDQCTTAPDGKRLDQYIILEQVIIDGLDVQNLIWSRSWYEPDYPADWAQQQSTQGLLLEDKVIGETWLSHNGTWYFQFTSPFYKFVIAQFR